MTAIGTAVIALIMFCAALGAIASIRDPDTGLGKEFLEGLYSIGHIFVPVAGIMAAVPLLAQLVRFLVSPAVSAVGADPSIAATCLIAVDMGGYHLADRLAESRESWIMAMMVGYMAGATIVFSIPVGLAMIDARDHKYLALGVLSGILAVPVGVLISSLIISVTDPSVRVEPRTDGEATLQLQLTTTTIGLNLIPLVAFVGAIAAGLRFFPRAMIRGFMVFGRLLDGFIKLVLAACIVEYFTEAFSATVGWPFDPIIADDEDRFRALEVAGYIGLMLAGAFPMVHLVRTYLAKPVNWLGQRAGLGTEGAAGLLASMANVLAMFRLVRDMSPKDKVLNIAFAVCAAFLFGDHLSFTANFQPNLIPAVIAGKLGGGLAAIAFAYWLSVPQAIALAATAGGGDSDGSITRPQSSSAADRRETAD